MARFLMWGMLGLFLFGLLAAVNDGGGGGVTRLTANATSVATTLSVKDTTGALMSDTIRIENELITYKGKTTTTLTNCVRGVSLNGVTSSAASHNSGQKVYYGNVDWVSSAFGFRIINAGGSFGKLQMVTLVWNFFTVAVPRWVTWDYSFLKVGFMLYIRIILIIVTSCIIIALAWQVALSIYSSFFTQR